MGFIKQRRIKHARKKAAHAARRREVLNLYAWGWTRRAIANKLNLHESTVNSIIKKG